ncbi:hypothetical protein [Microbacterium azadirachtae]|uniref:hypothetical protein n=1 Tax=Microbacterium azadirachtae TaxID=582680 RepID=UPI0012E01179|nr:hypothetical protein [Microbacterium azadirachtae]
MKTGSRRQIWHRVGSSRSTGEQQGALGGRQLFYGLPEGVILNLDSLFIAGTHILAIENDYRSHIFVASVDATADDTGRTDA